MPDQRIKPSTAAARSARSASEQTQLDLRNEHEASEYLQVSVKTLRNWRCTGAGPRFRKLGALVRYDRADLDAFASRVVKGGRDPCSA